MELKAIKREIFDKKVNSLRRQGLLPAELYGHGTANWHLAVDAQEFKKVYQRAGENTIVNLMIDDLIKPVLIYDVQLNPLTGAVQAVDFYEVKMDEKLRTSVPLEFIGEPAPVKAGLGVFVKAMDEIEVEALPADIPHKITVDVSSLSAVGSSLYVKDLPVTGKFRFMVEGETVVASIAELTKEEEKVETITPEQVVVETEEKKAAREAAKFSGEDAAQA